MNDVIYIKPHHFIDIITSFGAGKVVFKPHHYGHDVHIVARKIMNNRDIILEIELGIDDICKPCKHNVNNICNDTIDTSFRPQAPSLKQKWNLLIDQRWCKKLKIKQSDRLSAKEFCERLRDLAGDITDIYREIPNNLTAERMSKMKEGIKLFLT